MNCLINKDNFLAHIVYSLGQKGYKNKQTNKQNNKNNNNNFCGISAIEHNPFIIAVRKDGVFFLIQKPFLIRINVK